tara:strand:+ start:186 stop:293 length:108 start_codon:yes stop_codon:yes gene_type:complete
MVVVDVKAPHGLKIVWGFLVQGKTKANADLTAITI